MDDGCRRTRLLIVSTNMHVGGVTSALLALLNTLDRAKFDITLMLYEHDGPLQGDVPGDIRLLPPARSPGGVKGLARKLASPRYVGLRLRAAWLEKCLGRKVEGLQLRARAGAAFARRWQDEYDLAISFIEFWPLYYTAKYVNARHKLAWIHVDYAKSTLDPRLDMCAYPAYDRIVMVAQECVSNFARLMPEWAERAVYLPNIVSAQAIRNRADHAPVRLLDRGRIRLITVARISFLHKGQDQGVRAFDALRRAGKLEGVVWYIVGGGEDAPALEEMIRQLGREREIIMLGEQLDPLPLVRQCDAFFLTSHYEGKPIAVTEAQILGLPSLVTRYESVSEQIEDGVDGLIVEDSEAGIAQGLLRLCETPGLLERLRAQVAARDYGNERDIDKYLALWREIGVEI